MKIKKLFALVMAMCMIFSMTTVAFAEDTTAGTAEAPIDMYYSAVATNVTIPAETAYYYNGWRIGGTTMTVTGADAYVIYDGTQYDAVDGVVSVELPASASPMVPTSIQIGNKGTSEATFSVAFVLPVGTQGNPEVLSELYYSYVDVSLLEGNSEGYYYTYTATADGTITFYIDTITEGVIGDMIVYNANSYTQLSISADGVENDYGYVAIDMPVTAGDVLNIQVAVMPDENWAYPAADITWYGNFEYPAGSVDNPIQVLDTTSEQTVAAGTSPYYQAYFAGMIMTIENENVSVIYNGETYTAENGVITVEFPASQSIGRPMPEIFQIVNNGTADETVEIVCTYPEGHMENPKKIEAGDHVAEITAGSTGFFYTWTAPSAGKLTVAVSSDKGWLYAVNNLTSYAYGETHYYDDETVVPSETITVAKGDEIQISVCTADADAYYASVDGEVNVKLTFESDEVTPPAGDDNDNSSTGTNSSPSTDNNSPSTEDTELEDKVNGSVDDKDAILDVSAPSAEAVDKVATAGKDLLKDKVYEILELDLYKNGVKLTQLADKIKVTLSVFDKIKDAKWVTVYRLDGETLTNLGTVEVKDGKFTFETDHFSTYVFAAADEPKADAEPETSDNAPVAAMVALAALAATAAIVVSKKRAEEM